MLTLEEMRAYKAKAKRQRDNWKARAIALEKELNAYKASAAKVDKCLTELCEMWGIEPVHPALLDPGAQHNARLDRPAASAGTVGGVVGLESKGGGR